MLPLARACATARCADDTASPNIPASSSVSARSVSMIAIIRNGLPASVYSSLASSKCCSACKIRPARACTTPRLAVMPAAITPWSRRSASRRARCRSASAWTSSPPLEVDQGTVDQQSEAAELVAALAQVRLRHGCLLERVGEPTAWREDECALQLHTTEHRDVGVDLRLLELMQSIGELARLGKDRCRADADAGEALAVLDLVTRAQQRVLHRLGSAVHVAELVQRAADGRPCVANERSDRSATTAATAVPPRSPAVDVTARGGRDVASRWAACCASPRPEGMNSHWSCVKLSDART